MDQDVDVVRPTKPKSPRVEYSALESLRVSLKEEITSEIKNLLMESQREMLKLLRSETGENVRNSTIYETENETRSFHTPTKTVRINSTSNHDTDTYVSRNMVTGVLTDSTNHPKRPKIRSQSQPAATDRPAVARTLFRADKIDSTTLSMPKALTASLPIFDGKSDKIELFEDFFRNNKKCTRSSRNPKKLTTFTCC